MPSNFLRYGHVTVRTINWPKHMAIWKNKTNLHTISCKKNSCNANTDKYHAVQGNGKCRQKLVTEFNIPDDPGISNCQAIS